MAAIKIGRIKGGKTRKSYEVKWNQSDKAVYISYAGWTNVGRKANSSGEAMVLAEAFAYDK